MTAGRQINNPANAFNTGGSWQYSTDDSSMNDLALLENGTGLTLYVGDIVCLDTTGGQAILATAAGDLSTVGVVGGYGGTRGPSGGAFLPGTIAPSRTDSGVTITSTSTTVTDAAVLATDLGRNVVGTGIAAGTTIVSVTAATSFVMSAAATSSAGTTVTISDEPAQIGPGWLPTASYPAGQPVPVTSYGFARVNINGASTTAAKAGLIRVSGSGAVTGAYVATGSITAAETGGFIAIPLQAYAARDVTLTTAGITGHDSVTALIAKV